jgi:predicted transcriptional regulator
VKPINRTSRGDWEEVLTGQTSPEKLAARLGISRATIYREAKRAGWPMPARKKLEVAERETRRLTRFIRIRMRNLSHNRAQTDQQVLRLIAKLYCHVESRIDELTENGNLMTSDQVTRMVRSLVWLSRLERERQDWIAALRDVRTRVKLVDSVTRERSPDPEEMAEATVEAPPPDLDAPLIPGPTEVP